MQNNDKKGIEMHANTRDQVHSHLHGDQAQTPTPGRLRRMRSALRALWCVPLALTVLQPVAAQTCVPPPDVIMFLDNSSSINDGAFDSMQQAIANFATSYFASAGAGARLAVVNWGCTGTAVSRDGCQLDTAVNWSSVASNFSYTGLNDPANKVCRTFSGFSFSTSCGGVTPNTTQGRDFLQHAYFLLAQDLLGFSGAQLFNGVILNPLGPTVAGPANTIIINFTDVVGPSGSFDSLVKEIPAADAGADFKYSNQLKAAGYKIVTTKVVRVNDVPSVVPDLAATSSVGGSYAGAVTANPADPSGNGTTPRALVIAADFAAASAALVSMVPTLTAICLPPGPGAPQSIPTLSAYALLVLSLLVAVAAWRRSRRTS